MRFNYTRTVGGLLLVLCVFFLGGGALHPQSGQPHEQDLPEASMAARLPGGRLLSVEHESSLTLDRINAQAVRLFGAAAPSARYSVDVFRIEYQTLGMDSEPTRIFARLFVPHVPEPGRRLPVYVFGAGTTGLTDMCRTSREDEIGVNWGLYQSHVLAHAGQGVIGILPDYMYFGYPDRLQPYFVPDAEGRVLLDAARAVYNFFATVGAGGLSLAMPHARPFLAGFSQGGHAIFAAADLAATYAPELRLGGLIGYGASTDIEDIFREFTVVAAPIIYTYAQLYGTDRFDPAVMIQEGWLRNLQVDVRRLCILGLQDYYPWGPDNFFRPDFLRALRRRSLEADFPEIHAILRENSTGLSGHGLPVLMLQGGNDVVIEVADMDAFVGRLRAAGSEVDYRVFPDSRHDTRQVGFNDALRWMEQRMRSEHD